MKVDGLTYRRLDYWTSCGYLRAKEQNPGSGIPREWEDGEEAVANRMVRLTKLFPVSIAADLARRGPGQHDLGCGVAVILGEDPAPEEPEAGT